MRQKAELPDKLGTHLVGMDEHFYKQGRPWVTLSYAQSLDGAIAARRGFPLPLSNSLTLKITHTLRARHAAILVGIGTLLADDPRLNVRLVPGADPLPVVLDSHLRFPLNARLLQGSKSPWVFTSHTAPMERETALSQLGARIFRTTTQRVDLQEMLVLLANEGIHSLMVEGGARVIGSFLQARLVDLVVLTLTPCFVGGLHALENLLESRPRLEDFDLQRFGDDLLVWGHPCWDGEL